MLYTKEAIKKRIKGANRTKLFFEIILYVILVPILIYNISLIFKAYKNPEKTPSFFGIKTYSIISGSMEPNLNIGDMVIVKETSEDGISKGDIISFREGQSVVTHRVSEIKIEDNKKIFCTKGDNNNAEDSFLVKFQAVEGKVIKKIPGIGYIALILKNKIVIVALAVVVYSYIVHSEKRKRKKRKRKLERAQYESEINKRGSNQE